MAMFFIEPFKRVGEISFGENRESVRQKMGVYKEFKKSRFSKNTTDAFEGCHVYYTPDNLVEAVELFRDAVPVFKSKNLFLYNASQIKALINDSSFVAGDGMLSFPSFGIDICVEDDQIESVFVHSKDY